MVDKDNKDTVYLVAVDGPAHGWLSVRGERSEVRRRNQKQYMAFIQPSGREQNRFY